MASSTSPAAAVPYFEFRTAERLPETHVWSGPHDYPTVEPVGRDAVPVVDMRDPDAARALARAAEDWGGFMLVGHGVPAELVARVEEQVVRLFDRPAPEKTRARRRPGEPNGYDVGPYATHFDKQMWSEGYTFSPAQWRSTTQIEGGARAGGRSPGWSPLGSAPAPAAIRSEFRRVWPDGGDDYDRFCKVMEEYHREMKTLSGKLLDVFFRALGLTDEQIAAGETERKISETLTPAMRLNLYPKCPDPERAMGLATHTDSVFFTVIVQNLVPGLQLFRPGPDRWVTVPVMPGAFTVVIDDLFHVLTNGRFHNVLHRAVVSREQQRISAPYGIGPPDDMKVAPLASAVLPGTKAVFRAVTLPEYLMLRKETFGTDKSALEMLQVAEGKGEA